MSYIKSNELVYTKFKVIEQKIFASKCRKLKYGDFQSKKVTIKNLQNDTLSYDVWQAKIALYKKLKSDTQNAFFIGESDSIMDPELIFHTIKQYSIKANQTVPSESKTSEKSLGVRFYTTYEQN